MSEKTLLRCIEDEMEKDEFDLIEKSANVFIASGIAVVTTKSIGIRDSAYR